AGRATPGAIVAPALREEKFGIEQGAEPGVVGTEREVHGDDAVGGLAQPAAILPLHAGGLLAGLGMARVVEDADGRGVRMIASDDLLHAIAGAGVVPDIAGEILLERAWSEVIEQRDRLNALALQRAELPAHVVLEMLSRLGPSEAVIEFAQERG